MALSFACSRRHNRTGQLGLSAQRAPLHIAALKVAGVQQKTLRHFARTSTRRVNRSAPAHTPSALFSLDAWRGNMAGTPGTVNNLQKDESAAGGAVSAKAHQRNRSGSEPALFHDAESDQDGDGGADDVMMAPEQAISAAARDWKKALDYVIPCVVAIKFMKARSFDTNMSAMSYATGFVVDKKRGLLLTNRHVVTPGPVRATGTFHNREMLTLKAVYYDPVHDFGFYRFNPTELKFMQLDEVALAPEEACVGLEVRVIGNDTGEKVSILAATIARLDRDAPNYSANGYNDFNTFYIQAASNSKGGSSGSPVVDCHGRAVGLNAGGKTRGASAFYLPLQRVVRALKLIQEANPEGDHEKWIAPVIPRGDLQSSFVFKGFDEVRRLGTSSETEKWVRDTSGSIGMLVVNRVVPGSPAEGKLEPGDVLVTVQGEVVTHFLRLEEILDAHVGQAVQLKVERGSTSLDLNIEVTNMHSVTPSSFIEVGRAILNSLSYQQAHNHRIPTGPVYVADSGDLLSRAGVPRCAIITSLNNHPTPTLESFAQVLQPLHHAARVPLEYFTVADRHITKNCIFQMDRQWHGPPLMWQRDDSLGVWNPTTIPHPTDQTSSQPLSPRSPTAVPIPNTHPIDTSPTPIDTSPTPIDASPTPIDTSPTPIDASPNPIDTSPTPIDTSPTPINTSPTPIDASPTPIDSSPLPLVASQHPDGNKEQCDASKTDHGINISVDRSSDQNQAADGNQTISQSQLVDQRETAVQMELGSPLASPSGSPLGSPLGSPQKNQPAPMETVVKEQEASEKPQEPSGMLQEAGGKLQDGVEDSQGGAKDVQEGVGKLLQEGAGKLPEGAGKLPEGADKVQEELQEGAWKLQGGVEKLQEGAGKVHGGAGVLQEGAGKPQEGAGKLQEGVTSVDPGKGEKELSVKELEEVARACMVQVDACVPHTAVLDGVARMRDSNNGVVVYQDSTRGLVLVDHFTVPISSVVANITFMAFPVEVRGDVQFLHPLHNFAIISYNTQDLPEEAREKVKPARLKGSPALQRGDTVRLVVLTRSMRLMSRVSHVTNASVTQQFPIPTHPRFRPVHEELILLDQDFGNTTGLLLDPHGYVRAMYAAYRRRVSKDDLVEYCAGMPVDIILPWVQGTIQQGHPSVLVLNAELEALPLAKAAQHGLPREWVARLNDWDSERRQVLRVFSCLSGSDAAKKLKPGDMLLELDGNLVSSFREVERIIQSYNHLPTENNNQHHTSADHQENGTAQRHAHATSTLGGPIPHTAQQDKSQPSIAEQDAAQSNIPQLGTAQLNVEQQGTAQSSIAGQGAAQMTIAQQDTAQQDIAEQGMGQQDVGQQDTAQQDKAQHGSVEQSAVQQGTARQSTAEQDIAEQDMVEQGTAAPGENDVPASGMVDGMSEGAPEGSGAEEGGAQVKVLICRARKLHTLQVKLSEESGMGTRRVVQWCGTLLQPPHRAIREVGLPEPLGNAEGVYIALCYAGSPAAKYSLFSQSFLTELDGVPIPDLDTFLKVASRISDGQFVRVKLCKVKSSKVKVLSLQTDALYWPTWQLQWDPQSSSWTRTVL